MPMPWKPSKRKGTMPSATATDPVARMESMLLGPLKAKPDEPVPPVPWRGKRSRGGGYAALMPTIDEFFGTSNQVCGGFWPFGTDMALPAEGVPVGRSLMTGAGVCCDPISWFKAGIIKQPSMFLARPAGHRQEHVRAPRGAGTERPGHERDHPRRSEARLRLTGQHARRPGHPAGSGHRRGQPPGPRRPPPRTATTGGRGAQGPDGLLQRHEGGAHGGAFDDHAHRPRGRRRGRCPGA